MPAIAVIQIIQMNFIGFSKMSYIKIKLYFIGEILLYKLFLLNENLILKKFKFKLGLDTLLFKK